MKFCLNRGERCAQTAIKSAVYRDKILSWNTLDKLTGRVRGQITTPTQIAFALHQVGKDFDYPVKDLFLSGNDDCFKENTLEMFGEEITKQTNFYFIGKAIKELRASKNYCLEDSFNLDKIKDYLGKGRSLICLINYDIFVGRENKNRGHYLIINDINKDSVEIMDSGPKGACSNRTIHIRHLEESLMQTPIDYGFVFV